MTNRFEHKQKHFCYMHIFINYFPTYTISKIKILQQHKSLNQLN